MVRSIGSPTPKVPLPSDGLDVRLSEGSVSVSSDPGSPAPPIQMRRVLVWIGRAQAHTIGMSGT